MVLVLASLIILALLLWGAISIFKLGKAIGYEQGVRDENKKCKKALEEYVNKLASDYDPFSVRKPKELWSVPDSNAVEIRMESRDNFRF